jgi:hypothetical protein
MGLDMNGIVPTLPIGNTANNDGFGFGAGGGWIVFLIIAMMFGWGGNGFGRGNLGGVTGGEVLADQFALQDLKNGHRSIEAGINGLANGICDSTYAMAQQGSQTREMLGFGLRDLGAQMANCCCETNRNIDAVRYDNSKNTCDIITNANMNTRDLIAAGNANTQRIVDLMTQNTIQELRDQKAALEMGAALQAQTATITAITNPRSIPAYPVCSPYTAYNPCGCAVNGCC